MAATRMCFAIVNNGNKKIVCIDGKMMIFDSDGPAWKMCYSLRDSNPGKSFSVKVVEVLLPWY
ncbi:hypothetical protein PP422_gp205 [Enterobacter phage vB_EhoM-IME523]|uniref:Uncharacterized protein n=1 Tax=Enterobacter phage vB_EhoM-IME523 TaxID=2596709 RepID=A0A7G3KEH3_9CAUD|nr:hypothetical protein PP422_gp205 [Enterobacter phage vB_EhoM-IME523]QEA10709.1 hypothetical protein [Enterobacter phage vB_EhoM-IME523]